MRLNNQNRAKEAKDDEFYTQLSDVEKELKNYKSYFKGKTIFLNCDDPSYSAFWQYFKLNFAFLQIKKVISTHYDPGKSTYKLEMTTALNIVQTPLKQNGDFRSDEAIELLKECDIVVTNPPFSLFREYIAQLLEYAKDFIIVGSNGALTYKDFFPLIVNQDIWLGYTKPTDFGRPDKSIKKVPTYWFTNLPVSKRDEDLILHKKYNPSEYPTYDNFDAIEVNKIKNIPEDFLGVMGVPSSFLEKHNPKQFEILGNEYTFKIPKGRCYIDGVRKYARIFIKRK